MDYAEYSPAPALRPYVRCFWAMRAESAGPERVVPDGCSEIVVNRADPVRRIAGGRARTQDRVLVVGQLSRALVIEPLGGIDLFGVRFEPAGLHAMLGVPMHELTDRDVCAGDLGRTLRDELAEAGAACSIAARIDAASRIIMNRIERGRFGAESNRWIVDEAVRHLQCEPQLAVGDIARRLRLHPRTLERAFRSLVGLSPKQCSRIYRLAQVLRLLDEVPQVGGWAGMAARAGYFDQPHLIRDFRALTGTTPSAYLRERPRFSECFFNSDVSHSSNLPD